MSKQSKPVLALPLRPGRNTKQLAGIFGADDVPIAIMCWKNSEGPRDAIIHAVNSHAALVAERDALKALVERFVMTVHNTKATGHYFPFENMFTKLRDEAVALSKGGGE